MKKLLSIAAAIIIIAALLIFAKQITCWIVTETNKMLGSNITCPFGS